FTSVRRSNFEWLYRDSNPNAELFFGDFNFKWNYRIGESDRLYFTLITGRDALLNQVDSSGISWGNLASTIRWNHVFGRRLFSNTTLYTGSYRYRLGFDENAWESAIGTLSLKTDFSHYISSGLKAAFGFEFAGFGFNPGTISTSNELINLPDISKGRSRKRVLYYQLEAEVSSKLELKAGLRLSSWQNLGPANVFGYNFNYEVKDTQQYEEGVYHAYFSPDPRISLKYALNRTSNFKISAGRYHQYIQLISNSVSPFTSFEVWLPSSPNIKPQAATQIDVSYLKYFEKSGIEFTLAAYYKDLENQIDYRPHANTIINPLLEGELRFGSMDAYGGEIQLKKEQGRLNGWINYTYSRAMRTTPALNNGKVYPAFQDRPHDFSVLLNYQITRRFSLSSYFTAYSGSAFSSPTGFYRYLNQTVPVYAEKNNDRLPAYQRLDLALKFTLNRNLQNRFQHSLNLSFYNALRHKNIVSVDFNKISNGPDRPVVPANFIEEPDLIATQSDLIRFMPSLTYKFEL
ncbi:MAG: TonB-dependent receptor, partial [Saprospiraceae bacterium]|nr:TonB-dependent receptor [Saprospiraceae bacterium]